MGIDKFKPVTGQVEYGEDSDTPLDAVVRELGEETGIVVDKSEALLVGIWWGNNFRGKIPDVNFAYAFKVSETVTTKPQEKEISQIAWTSVKEYFSQKWIEDTDAFLALANPR